MPGPSRLVSTGAAGGRAAVARHALAALLLGVGGLFAAAAWSQAEPPARSELQWLQVIQAAAQRLSYVGTIVFEQGGEVRSSRIVHYFDGTSSHERLQMLDGKPREFIRRDDEVQCLFPEAKRVLIERRPGQDAFPALSQADPGEILAHYRLRIGPVDRVAGHECQVIQVEPRDRLRYGYRLCVERASGLLLKAQTLDERGEILEQMAFSDVRIGERIDRAQLQPSWSTEGWRIERPDHKEADLARSGWNIAAPSGFRKLKEISRQLVTRDGRERSAMQAVYSDGLATLSVFIEPRTARSGAGEQTQSHGPTSAYVRRIGDALVTVVGEVPPATVRSVAQSVTQSSVPPATPSTPR